MKDGTTDPGPSAEPEAAIGRYRFSRPPPSTRRSSSRGLFASDAFLDDIGQKLKQPELQVALLKKLLSGEIRTRLGANRTQSKRLSDELQAVLDRYHGKQLTSAQVVAELVKLAKKLRDQRDRNEQEAKVRLRIKRILRKHKALVSLSGGGGLDHVADRVFQQAKLLYERWPEIEGDSVTGPGS